MMDVYELPVPLSDEASVDVVDNKGVDVAVGIENESDVSMSPSVKASVDVLNDENIGVDVDKGKAYLIEYGSDLPYVTRADEGKVLQVVSGEWAAAEFAGIDESALQSAVDEAIESAKEDGSFNGEDGFSPVVSASKSGTVTTITITDKNGTKTATIKDGADGKDGSNGQDGTSVTITSVSGSSVDGANNYVTFSDGTTLTVKNGSKGSAGADGKDGVDGRNGIDGVDGRTPIRGVDYWTDADKAEIKSYVDNAILNGAW